MDSEKYEEAVRDYELIYKKEKTRGKHSQSLNSLALLIIQQTNRRFGVNCFPTITNLTPEYSILKKDLCAICSAVDYLSSKSAREMCFLTQL